MEYDTFLDLYFLKKDIISIDAWDKQWVCENRAKAQLNIWIVAFYFFIEKAYRNNTCGPFSHECDNGRCIKFKNVCDGTDDCKDKTDEVECGMYVYCKLNNISKIEKVPRGIRRA